MNFLDSIIDKLNFYECKLVRSGDDFDFLLLNVDNRQIIKEFLLEKGFILFKEESNKLNFIKFHNGSLIDIDIDIDIDTLFLQTYFYDIKTTQDLKERYFQNSEKEKICVNTIRYILLLRGFNEKYLNFFIQNRDFILKNGYCLDYLTSLPFKREFKNFEDFLKVMKRDFFYMLKYIKFRYLIRYFEVKFFKKRGKVIAFIGIDGSGKSTIIDILNKNFGYKFFYLGDRSIKFSKLYKIKLLKPISIFMQYFEKFFRVGYIKFLTLKGKHILTDRYYFEINTHGLRGKIYDILYNRLLIKPDLVIVLWADSEEILTRKHEASKEEIEKFNQNINNLPFNNKVIIENINLDKTLNEIVKVLK